MNFYGWDYALDVAENATDLTEYVVRSAGPTGGSTQRRSDGRVDFVVFVPSVARRSSPPAEERIHALFAAIRPAFELSH